MLVRLSIRMDSKSIALLALFTSLVIALEVFPVIGITDIITPVPNFTIDWTGIPIMIVFLGLGNVFAFITIITMWISIVYRNPTGAAFKGLAESFTFLGLIIANLIVRNKDLDWKRKSIVYLIFGGLFRSIGMLFGNTFLFNLIYGMPYDGAFALSSIYIPWNIVQAIINILGGVFLYQIIPLSLRIQAGFGKYRSTEYEELSADEIISELEEQSDT
jgi:riboflavin transporter FmnP